MAGERHFDALEREAKPRNCSPSFEVVEHLMPLGCPPAFSALSGEVRIGADRDISPGRDGLGERHGRSEKSATRLLLPPGQQNGG